MADIKIVTGRAGSGKSSFCIKEISEYINNREDKINGPAAFLIVPEQLSVQAERRLLTEAKLDGLLRDEVLSFKRAAYRVLGNAGGLKYEMLTQSGKIMLLTQAIKQVSESLVFYGVHASKPRGMEAILQLIEEFGRYGATSEKLKALSEKEETDALLKAKLYDLSIIYDAYRELAAKRFYDSETLYNDMICEMQNDKTFQGAHIWIDGFGGFTSQEYDIIKGFFNICASVTISVCTDRNGGRIFDNPNETCTMLEKIASECGFKCRYLAVDDGNKIPPRFAENKYLAHLEKYYNKYPCKTMQGADTGISVTECGNMYYEVTECAKEIVRLHSQGIKYSEIAVVSGDLSLYGNAVSAVFPLYNVPYFVDEKRGIDTHPLIRYILELLELASSNWSYLSVFSFLKTGLYDTNIYLIDKLENDILKNGIKGRGGKKGWKAYVERECDNEHKEAVCDLAKSLFSDIEEFKESLKKCKDVSSCCKVLVDFLEKNNVFEKVSKYAYVLRENGRLDEADEYSRIWNIAIEVIEQANNFLDDIKLTSAKATFMKDILANGFAQYKAGFIPHSAECVQIGTPERSKSLNPKVLFILGANEGIFPKTVKDNGLLTDSDREYMFENDIVLSDDNRKRVFYADFVVYSVIASASHRLYVSYSLTSASGDAQRPSSVVRHILKLFPDMKLKFGSTGGLLGKGVYTASEGADSTDVSIENAARLFNFDGDAVKLSVSRLEKYNKCPYSFLLDYGLKLKPRKEYSMEVSDTGSLLHAVIEKASKVASESPDGLKGLDLQKCSEIVDSVFDEAVLEVSPDGDIFLGTERSAYFTSRMKSISVKELEKISSQLKHNKLLPYGFEMKYGPDGDSSFPPVIVECDGFKVLLNGKIDRVDIGEVASPLSKEDVEEGKLPESALYFRVIDYKSSEHSLDIGEIVNGTKLQLITYISAVANGLAQMPEYRDKRIIPASAFYYEFKKNIEKIDERFNGDFESVKQENFMKGLYLADESIMGSLHTGVIKLEGTPLKNKPAVPEGGFERLTDSANTVIQGIAENMKKGKFPVRPIIKSDYDSACHICEYQSVCRVHSDPEANSINPKVISAKEYWGC